MLQSYDVIRFVEHAAEICLAAVKGDVFVLPNCSLTSLPFCASVLKGSGPVAVPGPERLGPRQLLPVVGGGV